MNWVFEYYVESLWLQNSEVAHMFQVAGAEAQTSELNLTKIDSTCYEDHQIVFPSTAF
jgi:hypothetical protein